MLRYPSHSDLEMFAGCWPKLSCESESVILCHSVQAEQPVGFRVGQGTFLGQKSH